MNPAVGSPVKVVKVCFAYVVKPFTGEVVKICSGPYNQLLVKVTILFFKFNLPKTKTKSEYLFIFTLKLQRKKRAGARQNLREILPFQREFHNEGISN